MVDTYKTILRTVVSGQPLTDIVDCGYDITGNVSSDSRVGNEIRFDVCHYVLTGIITPAAIDGTAFTFQVSNDNVTYVNLYNADGEVNYTMAASRGIVFNVSDFIGWRYMKIRLGTAGSPTNATANRILTCILRPV